ncbi:MAG: TonB C-terminal domain-containing protein [Polyangiales bacterium]
MYVARADQRPQTTFDLPTLTKGSFAGGVSSVVGVAVLLFVLFGVLPRLAVAAGILEPSDIGAEPEPIAEPEPEVIQAAFVQLGREFDPRELPDRQVARSSLSPRRQDPNVVSQLTRAMTDGGVPPPNAYESMLTQLGNRAQFIESTSLTETEGSAEGNEEGRRTGSGSLFAGQIVSLFRRGLRPPPTIPDTELATLSTRVTVVINADMTFQGIRISQGSGNSDYDRAVQNRIDEILSSNTVLTPPEDDERERYIGRPFSVNVVPPGSVRRRAPAGAAPSGGGASALERLGAGYSTGE